MVKGDSLSHDTIQYFRRLEDHQAKYKSFFRSSEMNKLISFIFRLTKIWYLITSLIFFHFTFKISESIFNFTKDVSSSNMREPFTSLNTHNSTSSAISLLIFKLTLFFQHYLLPDQNHYLYSSSSSYSSHLLSNPNHYLTLTNNYQPLRHQFLPLLYFHYFLLHCTDTFFSLSSEVNRIPILIIELIFYDQTKLK